MTIILHNNYTPVLHDTTGAGDQSCDTVTSGFIKPLPLIWHHTVDPRYLLLFS